MPATFIMQVAKYAGINIEDFIDTKEININLGQKNYLKGQTVEFSPDSNNKKQLIFKIKLIS
jgi:hypothetical protein